MVTLNRIVAVAAVHGAATALTQLGEAVPDPALAGHHRVDVVRAHLLELLGDVDGASRHYERAARSTLSLPEQRYLDAVPTWDPHSATSDESVPLRARQVLDHCSGATGPSRPVDSGISWTTRG